MAYVYIPPSEEGLMQTINQQYHPLPMEQALGICWKSGSWMGEVRQIVENTWFLYISKKKKKKKEIEQYEFLISVTHMVYIVNSDCSCLYGSQCFDV